MNLNLVRFLNKPILVSIPALFDDGLCRPYKLLGAELTGLWLQSDDLAERLLPAEATHFKDLAPAVFVPFSFIAGVLVPTGVPKEPVAAESSGNNDGSGSPSREQQPSREKFETTKPARTTKKRRA